LSRQRSIFGSFQDTTQFLPLRPEISKPINEIRLFFQRRSGDLFLQLFYLPDHSVKILCNQADGHESTLEFLAIFFLKNGAVNELDFWGGTFCLVLFATVETILFGWIFGIEKAWEEIHHGAEMRVPKIYKFIIKYITPLFLFLILGFWLYQEGMPVILMKGANPGDKPYILGIRIMLLGIFLSLAIFVKIAWQKRKPSVKK